MGSVIYNADILGTDSGITEFELSELIERGHGFAEVFPEHKYQIVTVLQKNGHRVGMTGDGVNDAPALKGSRYLQDGHRDRGGRCDGRGG